MGLQALAAGFLENLADQVGEAASERRGKAEEAVFAQAVGGGELAVQFLDYGGAGPQPGAFLAGGLRVMFRPSMDAARQFWTPPCAMKSHSARRFFAAPPPCPQNAIVAATARCQRAYFASRSARAIAGSNRRSSAQPLAKSSGSGQTPTCSPAR